MARKQVGAAPAGPFDTVTVGAISTTRLGRFRRSLAAAAAGQGTCRIVVIGESLEAGHGTADLYRYSWPGQVRTALARAGYPIAGTGPVPVQVGYNEWHGAWPATTGGWSATGTAANPSPGIMTTGVGSTITFVSPDPGTVVRITVPNWVAPFKVTIDGGSPVTVTPVDAGDDALWTWEQGGLSDTTHTVVIESLTGTNSTRPFVVSVADVARPTGVQVINLGYGGSSAKSWNDSKAGYASYLSAAKWLDPDLVILGWGGNDLLGGVTLPQYETAIRALVAEFDADIVLRGLPDGTGAGINTTPVNAIMRTIASESPDTRLFVDMWNGLGSYAEASGAGLSADAVHPNRGGYWIFAQTFLTALQQAVGIRTM